MQSKKCTKCSRVLSMDAYHRSKAFKTTGRVSICKECIKAYQTEYKKTDKYKKAYSKWWKKRGKAWRLKYQRERRRTPEGAAVKRKYDQSEKGKAANKRYTSSEKARAKIKAAYRKRMVNPEYQEKKREYWRLQNKRQPTKEAQKRYRQTPHGKAGKLAKDKRYKGSPLGLESAKRSNTKRKRLKAKVACTLTLQEWQAIQAAYDHRCAYCGQKKPLTQDHVQALVNGGSHTKENVIPACRSCNAKKGTKKLEPILTPEMFGSSQQNP